MSEVIERMKKKNVVKPIVYGNTATPFAQKRDADNHTHQWTVFFRPYLAEDPTKWIRKVQFKLHESYTNPYRVCEKPPYEVTETGWGEFEIQIRIYFIDPNEKPITAFHYLRLFQPTLPLPSGKHLVCMEFYDEVIFQEPTVQMYRALQQSDGKRPDKTNFLNDIEQVKRRTLELAEHAQREMCAEIEDLRESLKEAHKLMVKYSAELTEQE
uniref:YEATS domain-containing protein n=1 Tax=Caenorhabditis japonica TaxID=281687 RepID=A0A8R1DJJ3_CAEJA